MSLSPSGREIDAELSYGSALLDGNAWLGGNLFCRRQPGHIADAPDDMGAAIRFTLGFSFGEGQRRGRGLPARRLKRGVSIPTSRGNPHNPCRTGR